MHASIALLGMLLLAGHAAAQLANDTGIAAQSANDTGEVAYASPPADVREEQLAADANATCAAPCYVVTTRSPYKQCGPSCDPAVCNRGYDAFQTQDVCCQVGFPDGGCTKRPDQCWVVESYQLRTCVRDDRKCMQGSGVFPTEAACCTAKGPGPLIAAPGAFEQGCGNVTKAAEPCWVVDTYFPTRQCRKSRTLCGADSGMRAFTSNETCCAPKTGAFGEGCSNFSIPLPCWVVDSYYPNRSCRRSSDAAVCYRGWGVFASEDVCCAPGASFSEGCTVRTSTPAAGAATPAATPTAAPATPGAAPATAPVAVAPATRPVAAAPPAMGPGAVTPASLPVAPVVVSTAPVNATPAVQGR